jgi:hypothetical protein
MVIEGLECVGTDNDGGSRLVIAFVLSEMLAVLSRSHHSDNDEHEIHVRRAHKTLEKKSFTIFTLLLGEQHSVCAARARREP